MILNIRHVANWNYMQERRQKVAAQNNRKENARRIPHKYNVGDLVLKSDDSITPTMQRPYEGPFKVDKAWDNGAVTIKRTVNGGAVHERLNIRRIKPYHRK